MTLSTSIRSATAQDAAQIAHVQVTSWMTTYAGIIPNQTLQELSVDRMKQMWETQQANPETSILIAEQIAPQLADQKEQLVGFAAAGPTRDTDHKQSSADAEIYAIYLLKEAQDQGIGRQLMRTMAQNLHERGFQSLFLWVLKANPALRFYEHIGGKTVSRGTVTLGDQDFEELAIEWPDLNILFPE